jgi:hypothetical protein
MLGTPFARFCLLVAAFALSGCVGGERAEMKTNAEREPDYYVCEAHAEGDFGSIWYTIERLIDGTIPYHRINWSGPYRAEGTNLHLQWVDRGPFVRSSERAADLWLSLRTKTRTVGEARLELRRRSNPSEVIAAGAFSTPHRWQDVYVFQIEKHWSDLRTSFGDDESLVVALVQSNGEVAQWEVLPVTAMTDLDRAIQAARPLAEAQAANYRTDCKVPEPIIVT